MRSGFSKRLTIRLSVFICALLILLPIHAFAKTDKGLDIVLVLDSSGSMKKNDPKRMRVEAARMFVTLLDEQDQVAIVSFSGKASSKEGLVSLKSYHNEQALLKSIETVSANGSYTNIHEALRKGYQLLKRSKRKEKIIVLMSDGKMDVGDHEKNLQLLERTLDELTPELAKKHIKIYSIAFTKNSYIPLLKLAAKDTNGNFTLLKSAQGIHQVFENIFERSKNPDMLPMQENSFIVDNSVNELTVVASKYRPDSKISLENPSGEDFTEDTEHNGIKWFSAKQFDLITITNPQPGYWNVKFSEGGNRAYVLTNLGLQIKTTKRQVQPGNPFEIQAWLEKDGHKINKRQLLNTTKFKVSIVYPDGHEDEMNLTDDGTEVGSSRHDGIYGNSIVLLDEGLHKITVYTQGETFDRQKSIFVTVKTLEGNNPFEIKDKPEPVEQAPVQKEPAPQEPVTPPPATTTHEPTTMEHPVVEDGKTDTLIEPKVPHDVKGEELKPQQAEPEAKQGIDVTSAIIAFVLFNIAIGGGIAGWVYYRRLKNKKQQQQEKTNSIDLSESEEGASEPPEAAEVGEEGGDISNDELT